MKKSVIFWTLLCMGFLSCASVYKVSIDEPNIKLEYLRTISPFESSLLSSIAKIDVDRISFDFAVDLYRVDYAIDHNGQNLEVSGLIAMPRTDNLRASIVWGHGTIPSVSDLPSRLGLYNGIFPAFILASGGYLVFLPDYAGYETRNPLYLDKDSEAKCITKLLAFRHEIAKQLRPKSSLNVPIGLVGFSQGGHAVASALEEWPDDLIKPDLVSIIAGPLLFISPQIPEADPFTLQNIMTGRRAAHTIYFSKILRSMASNQGLRLSDYVKPQYESFVMEYFDGQKSINDILSFIGARDDGSADIGASDLLSDQGRNLIMSYFEKGQTCSFIELVKQRSIKSLAIDSDSIRFYAGTNDKDVVLAEVRYEHELLAPGSQLIIKEGASHNGTALLAVPDTRQWADSLWRF